MNFNDNTPIFSQVMAYIKAQVAVGYFETGQKIPSIREMSQKLKINPNTVSRAYQELERQGITVTQRGLGVFVAENVGQNLKEEIARGHTEQFAKEMATLGFSEAETVEVLQNYFNRKGE
ncbi:MAG: GntR family transcriptional regulator [Defluviitaleaceae bacterium]|nr:GntR family transcriptional regulator [Defluviitaleaceae bacterium]